MKQLFFFVIFSFTLLFSYSIKANNNLSVIFHYPQQPVALGQKQLLMVTVKSNSNWQQGSVTLTDKLIAENSDALDSHDAVINSFVLPSGKKLVSHYLPVTVLNQGILYISGTINIMWPQSERETSYPINGFGIAASDRYAFFGRNTNDAISHMALYDLKQDKDIANLLKRNQQGLLSDDEWQQLYKAFYVKSYQLIKNLKTQNNTSQQDNIIDAIITNHTADLSHRESDEWSDLLHSKTQANRYLPLYLQAFDHAQANKSLPNYVYKARSSGTVTAVVNTHGYFIAEINVNNAGKAEYINGNHYMVKFSAQAGQEYKINIKKLASAAGLYSIELYQH